VQVTTTSTTGLPCRACGRLTLRGSRICAECATGYPDPAPKRLLTKTLLACPPGQDCNQRVLIGPGKSFTFNAAMRTWSPDDDAVLERLVAFLNKTG
jgi:hypothetical protein